MGALDAVRERELVRPVDDHEPVCAGRLVGVDRLVGREVAADALLRLGQGRLAEEEVGVAGELDEPFARRGVGAVREDRSPSDTRRP